MKTYSNSVAYVKRAMATDVDACNATGISATTLYNGELVTLSSFGAGVVAGTGYNYVLTPTAANTAVDVWMVMSPEVNRQLETNVLVDPRSFEIEAGRPADIIRPMPGTDAIHVSIDAFTTNLDPATVGATAKFVTADADGKLKAVASATGVTGIVFAILEAEPIPVGQEMVAGWIIKCIQNPNAALA